MRGVPDRPSGLRRFVLLVVVAAVVLALVRGLLVQSFVIPTPSMAPTLQVGDRVLVFRSAYRLGEMRRGDLVVFDGSGVFDPGATQSANWLAAAGRGLAELLGVPVDERAYAKRVIGLPGERIACCDDEGGLTVDGEPLDEPWLAPGQAPSLDEFDVVVPQGRYWVMGDNREDSADSRAHLGDPGGGTVPEDRIVGRIVTVYWPFDRIGSPHPPRDEETA